MLLSEIAATMGWDVVEFKRKNVIKEGEELLMAKALGEGREGFAQIIRSSGLEQCVQVGLEAMDWYNKRGQMNQESSGDPVRRGIGMAIALHGSGVGLLLFGNRQQSGMPGFQLDDRNEAGLLARMKSWFTGNF